VATVSPEGFAATVHAVPTGITYSVLLLLHIGSAVIGFGAVSMTGWQAWRAARGPGAPAADSVRRYFRPGANIAARALYGVPVFGLGLVVDSHGAFTGNDGFVVAGLILWLGATVVAEVVVWPGERRLQQMVRDGWEAGRGRPVADEGRRVAAAATVLVVVFVVAVVLMVTQP